MTRCYHQRIRTKFINYLQGFHITVILENILKHASSDSKKETYRGAPLQQIWILQANDFFQKFPPRFFIYLFIYLFICYFEFGEFFKN